MQQLCMTAITSQN